MTIPNDTKIKAIQYRPEFSTINLISKKIFYGNLEIEYYPKDKLLEFVAFEEWINDLNNQEFTIESLCDVVFNKITDELGFVPLSVMVNARTSVHSPVTVVRARTAEEIHKNPVMKNINQRKILVPTSPLPRVNSTKRGKR
jgi:NADPH-dependent 7-cyano-7-deazaguanine reductase QueF